MLVNNNIIEIKKINTPSFVKQTHPITDNIRINIIKWRKTIEDILSNRDKRLLVIIGPCSIHDPDLDNTYDIDKGY